MTKQVGTASRHTAPEISYYIKEIDDLIYRTQGLFNACNSESMTWQQKRAEEKREFNRQFPSLAKSPTNSPETKVIRVELPTVKNERKPINSQFEYKNY